jgi:ankyrin repeat domain-containing protein 50
MNRERGLLWVKGKPGTGKSTLMAFIYRPFQEVPIYERHVYLGFFFHGRGTMLQKTPIGMFRSLVHQLFARVRSVREPIQKAYQEKMVFGEPGEGWEWQLKELQDLFFNAVTSIAGARPITIFIDALDEAGTKAAEELVTYFHDLNDQLADSNSATKICISCRHYPVVSLIPGLEICVENENSKDISTFVHDQLYSRVEDWEIDLSSVKACKELEDAIAKRTLGVFQWASLVIPMVAKWLNNGESLEDIYQMLARVPEELSDVYEHILKNVIESHQYPRALHLMQWICLAKRPLSVTELRFAMASDDMYIHVSRISCKDAKGFVETDTRMEKLIRSLSGGLAEVEHHDGDSTVQFVHQSVNDFLLSNGLSFLVSASADGAFSQAFKPSMSLSGGEIIGQSEHRLSRSCINYLKLGEVLRGDRIWDWNQRAKNQRELPLIDYATKSWFLHAEKAEIRGISQHELAEQFESPPYIFETWISIYRSIEDYSHRCPKQDSTLLHIASSSNLQSTVRFLLATGKSVEEEDSYGNRALHYAARWGHKELADILLDVHAEIGPKNKYLSTPLEQAAGNGHEEVLELLLRRGANVNEKTGKSGNALQAAARRGSTTLVRILTRSGAMVNAQGGGDGNALQAAALSGSEAVVQLLLDNGAEVNAQAGYYGTALQAAAILGHEKVVQLLLDNKAEVNAQGGRYGNALQAAAYHSHKNIVKTIIDKQCDINKEDSQGRLALYLAMRGNQHDMIDYLLDIGARLDPTHTDRQGCSALHFAASGGCISALRLAIDSSAKINALDTNGWTPLHWACRNGSRKAVQLLIDSGATLESKDSQGRTPFDVAVICDNSFLLSILVQSSSLSSNEDRKQEILAPTIRHWLSCASCFHVSYPLSSTIHANLSSI